MKKRIIFFTALFWIFITPFIDAKIAFQDTFNNITTVGDVNTEISASGRQFGTLAPLSYVSGANTIVGSTAMFPDKLTITNRGGYGPGYDFMGSDNLTIEFDLFEAPTGGGDWLSIAFGKDIAISGPNSAGSGLGILFRGEGAYQYFDEDASQSAGLLPAKPYHVLISVSMEDSASTKAAIFIDSKPINLGGAVALGTHNPFIYRKLSAFSNNNISFFNLDIPLSGRTGVIDNLTVNYTSPDFSEYNWTDDLTSQISSNKTYSHAVNLGADSNTTINGVVFTGSGANISGANWSLINGAGDNNFGRLSVSGTTISGTSSNLVNDFFYEGYAQSGAIILSNLIAGQSYAFALYNRGFGSGLRESFFAPSDSGSAMVKLDQNASGASGKLVKYFYTAPSNGVFAMAISTVTNAGWHFYAFSNELVPPQPVKNVFASQGTYSNKVVVSWDTDDTADKYQVWRNDSDDSSSATAISTELSVTTFTDTTATVNLDYYYWVKAGNTNGWSKFSESALGFSTDSTGPAKPTNISPLNGAEFSEFPITLVGSPYSDAEWQMESIQWQIADNTNYSSITWDSGEILTNATSIAAPSGPLVSTNYWRVRYKNNRNKWSEWSDYTSFIVERDFDSPFYFYDTFNNITGSGDVNKDYFVSGRQLGSAAPVDYVHQGTTEVGDGATNPDKLTLSGENSSCSPNQSFTKYENFKIDIDMEPSIEGAAICFGKMAKNAQPGSSGGMGFVFYGDGSGRYEIFNSETLVGVFTNDAVKTSPFQLQISVADNDGNELIAAFIDGKPLVLYHKFFAQAFHSNHYNYVYEKGGSFIENYITLYNQGGSSKFDNLQIQKTTTNLNVYSWTDDADSRIDSANNYTHAVNLNTVGNIDINSVTFIGSGTSAVYGLNPVDIGGGVIVHQRFVQNGTAGLVGSNWVISAADDLFQTDSDWSPPGNSLPTEGNKLLNHFLFSSWDGVEIKLNNLTPGSSNVFAMHFFEWGAGFEMPIAASDGGAPQNTSMDIGSPGDGLIFEYKYKAAEDGTFSFTISKVQHPLFSFCNYETTTPEPNLFTIDSLDFGEVVQGETKTFQLPVFNFGAGIVSGNVNGISAPFSFSGGSDYSAQPESPDFVNITFAPTGEDYFSNTVSLIGSGGNKEVLLTGVGVPEPLGLFFIATTAFLLIYKKSAFDIL